MSAASLGSLCVHPTPAGSHFFNTTDSPDAQHTAASLFPYALRVGNFLAVSDSPLTFKQDRWESVVLETTIDGVAALDTTSVSGRATWGRLHDLLSLIEHPR